MPTLAFPVLPSGTIPRVCRWGYAANTQVFSSPLNQTVQTLELPGLRWRVHVEFPSLAPRDAGFIKAHRVQMAGRAGRVYLYDFGRPLPLGTIAQAGGGTPLVMGASQTGRTLIIDGVTAGRTLLAGDYIGVNGELKMVLADATATGGGVMTLTIGPQLRSSPADNAVITIDRPTATFMLANDEQEWEQSPGGNAQPETDAMLDYVEAFV